MSLFFMLPTGLDLGVVTLSGEAVTLTDLDPVVGIRFNTDGTISRNQDGSYSAVDSATDWIIPNASASNRTFHLQATLNAESGAGTKVGTLSSWLELSTAREWSVQRIVAQGSGTSTWDLDIAISDDGGSTTLATALFELDSVI